jgi:signal peptidase I
MNKFLKVALAAFLICVSFFAVATVALVYPVAISKDWALTLVQNDDMQPAVPNGSLVITERVSTSDIKERDIVALSSSLSSDNANVSRLISKSSNGDSTYYQLQGDNNSLPDEWSYEAGETTYRLMTFIPLLGFLLSLINNPVGATLFILLTLGAVFAFIKMFYIIPRKEKPEPIDMSHRFNGVDEIERLLEELAARPHVPTRRERRIEKKQLALAGKYDDYNENDDEMTRTDDNENR